MSVVTDGAVSRFLSITHTTNVDEWRAMIERKSQVNRYFRELDQAAKKPAKTQPKVKVKAPRTPKARKPKPRAVPKPYEPQILPCPTCGKNTRPDSPVAQKALPEVSPRKSKGLCLACYRRTQHKTHRDPNAPKIRPCDKCGDPTRPARSSVGDYPGTRARWTGETCQRCYMAARRAKK